MHLIQSKSLFEQIFDPFRSALSSLVMNPSFLIMYTLLFQSPRLRINKYRYRSFWTKAAILQIFRSMPRSVLISVSFIIEQSFDPCFLFQSALVLTKAFPFLVLITAMHSPSTGRSDRKTSGLNVSGPTTKKIIVELEHRIWSTFKQRLNKCKIKWTHLSVRPGCLNTANLSMNWLGKMLQPAALLIGRHTL